jgi:transcriptional regulator GlxA family with amidase domain
MQKRVAFLVYPMFCNYEIALTLATLRMFDVEIVTFALDRNPIRCEEGLTVVPDRALGEFDPAEFNCLLLSGIGGNPDEVLNNSAYPDFLRKCDGREIVVAGISLAPVLMAKAGLLRGRRFCVGMYEEDRAEFVCFEYERQVRAPLVADGDRITAMGLAFREFALAVARALGFECRDNLWSEVKYPIRPEDYIFHFNG